MPSQRLTNNTRTFHRLELAAFPDGDCLGMPAPATQRLRLHLCAVAPLSRLPLSRLGRAHHRVQACLPYVFSLQPCPLQRAISARWSFCFVAS